VDRRGTIAQIVKGQGMSVAINRPAEERDLEALATLYAEFHAFHVRGVPRWLRIPEGDVASEEPRVRAAIGEVLRHDDAVLIVAEAEGIPVGLVEVYLRQDTPNAATISYTYGYVQSLAVTAAWRGRGIGSGLIEAARAWAREHGATQVRLDTWEFAAGPLPFYEALGFRTLKRTLAEDLL
jgi:GNAT superfamily N-acetyltransferase